MAKVHTGRKFVFLLLSNLVLSIYIASLQIPCRRWRRPLVLPRAPRRPVVLSVSVIVSLSCSSNCGFAELGAARRNQPSTVCSCGRCDNVGCGAHAANSFVSVFSFCFLSSIPLSGSFCQVISPICSLFLACALTQASSLCVLSEKAGLVFVGSNFGDSQVLLPQL